MKKRLLLAAASSVAILCSYAQINSPNADGYLLRAINMYDGGNYFGCLDQLIKINEHDLTTQQVQQIHYYRALATMHTDRCLAIQLLETYLSDYPSALNANDALMALGDCYYGSDYNKALEIYQHVYVPSLSESQSDTLDYRMAYCYLMTERLDKAMPLFESLTSSSNYANAATFYCGYINYAKGDYAKALRQLQMVDTSTEPGYMADYYLSQIYFMRNDYAKALSTARNVLKRDGMKAEFVAEANRIAGESSYRMGDDRQAVKYLHEYVSMVEVPLPSAMYILGLSAYNTGGYKEAIEYLTPVTQYEDAMGQSAYLYLGQAYMHTDDYTAAAMAFNRALNMHYDSSVRETAYYNYAVASTRGGTAPFASTVKIFSDFLRLYPNSTYAPEVQEYIITSYITDNNYPEALQSINQMSNPSEATLAAKQRVLYVLGNKALALSEYDKALTYLTEAKTLAKYDATTDNEVALALGEAYYGMGDLKKSVEELKRYIAKAPATSGNLPLAHYDLGYALFAQGNYSAALTQFDKCLQLSGDLQSNVIADAYNRLGDCYYHAKDFAKAESAYDNAYSRNPSTGDYALFQKALMAGYQRNHQEKINMLDRMLREFPSSALAPDAMLETTEAYIQIGNNTKAIEAYKRLVEKYPNTAQGRQGYLQMALVKLNNGDRTGAIADYREVIRRYPTSDEAKQAVEQMKRIAATDGTLVEFNDFLHTVDNAPQMDESEIEQLTFESAESQYLANGNTDKLEDFIDNYPDSNMRARAISYLIDSENGNGNNEAAYEYACALVSQYPSSSYAQQALIVKAQIEELEGKGNLAVRTWQQLAETASSPDNLLKARMGIIRNGRDNRQYDDMVIDAANAVISSSAVGADDMTEAMYSRGYVLNIKGEIPEARDVWQKAADHIELLYGIQSAYMLGQSYYDANNLSQAESWAKKVVNADSPHTYWIARGFILLSDVYAAQGDKFKSRQYLEAVRDNYSGQESDIFMMIDQRLK